MVATATQELTTMGRPQADELRGSLRKARWKKEDNRELAIMEAFDDFQTLGDPELEKALREAKQFCREMASGDKPARWLTLLGQSGTGKTMLAKRISRFFGKYLDALPDERNMKGEAWTRRGGFKQWVDIVQDMVAGDYSGIRDLRDDWFLVLDDIGAEYKGVRELAIAKLYEILNARLGLWTVVTANISFEAISDKLDQRIASRLLRNHSALVVVAAPDFNERNA